MLLISIYLWINWFLYWFSHDHRTPAIDRIKTRHTKLRSHPKNVTPKRIVITTTQTKTVRPSFRISATTNSVASAWAVTRNYRRRCHHRRRWPHRQPVRKLRCHLRRRKRNGADPYRGNRNWNDVVARRHRRLTPTTTMQKTCPNRRLITVDRSVIRGGTFWCPIISSIGEPFLFFIFYSCAFTKTSSLATHFLLRAWSIWLRFIYGCNSSRL